MENNAKILPNILIAGTPGTGKSTISKILTDSLNNLISNELNITSQYFTHYDLSYIVNNNKGLTEGFDTEYNCSIFNEDNLLSFITPYINKGGCIIDFHTINFFPDTFFDLIIIVRTDNKLLYDRLKGRGYNEKKITDNIDCEIFEEIKLDAYELFNNNIIFEITNNYESDMNNNIQFIFDKLKHFNIIEKLKILSVNVN